MKKTVNAKWLIIGLLCINAILLAILIVRVDSNGKTSNSEDGLFSKQEEFDYVIIDGEVTITGYSGKNMDLVIPKTIEGYPVTRIGKSAFSGHEYLNSVIIPDGVVAIGDAAFSKCYDLTRVELPESLVTIGGSAFMDCDGLTDMIIPNSVVTIGGGAFSYCDGLTSIVIPDSVTSVGDCAFSNCDELKSITIPDSVSFIGYNPLDETNIKTIYVKENSYAHQWFVQRNFDRKVQFY